MCGWSLVFAAFRRLTGLVSSSANDNKDHTLFPQQFAQQHLSRGTEAAALSAGGHADLSALVRGLPVAALDTLRR